MRLKILLIALCGIAAVALGANVTISPNMGMPVPVVGTDPGPDWANNINASLSIVDSHDHSPGHGVQITPAGINLNADLPFNVHNATLLRSTRFSPQGSPLSGGTDQGALYESGADLYYNDGNGNQIRITQSGSVAGSTGTITGLPSGTASAAYSAGTFTFQSATNTPANMSVGPISISRNVVNPFAVTVAASGSQGANYALTLPTALPGSTSVVTLDSSGNLASTTGPTLTSPTINAGTFNSPTISSAAINGSSLGTSTFTGGTITGSIAGAQNFTGSTTGTWTGGTFTGTISGNPTLNGAVTFSGTIPNTPFFTNGMVASAGSASTPAFGFASEDTGMYLFGSHVLGLAVNNTTPVTLTTSLLSSPPVNQTGSGGNTPHACVVRQTTNTGTVDANCLGGETATGGGCFTVGNMQTSFPLVSGGKPVGWECHEAASGNVTTYAICCPT